MGAHKLKEYEKPVQLTPLWKPEEQRKSVLGFITLILVLLTSFISATIIFSSEKEANLEEFIEEAVVDKSNDYKKFVYRQLTKEEVEKYSMLVEDDLLYVKSLIDQGDPIWILSG